VVPVGCGHHELQRHRIRTIQIVVAGAVVVGLGQELLTGPEARALNAVDDLALPDASIPIDE